MVKVQINQIFSKIIIQIVIIDLKEAFPSIKNFIVYVFKITLKLLYFAVKIFVCFGDFLKYLFRLITKENILRNEFTVSVYSFHKINNYLIGYLYSKIELRPKRITLLVCDIGQSLPEAETIVVVKVDSRLLISRKTLLHFWEDVAHRSLETSQSFVTDRFSQNRVEAVVDEDELLMCAAEADIVCLYIAVNDVKRVQLPQNPLQVPLNRGIVSLGEPLLAELGAELNAIRTHDDVEPHFLFDFRAKSELGENPENQILPQNIPEDLSEGGVAKACALNRDRVSDDGGLIHSCEVASEAREYFVGRAAIVTEQH